DEVGAFTGLDGAELAGETEDRGGAGGDGREGVVGLEAVGDGLVEVGPELVAVAELRGGEGEGDSGVGEAARVGRALLPGHEIAEVGVFLALRRGEVGGFREGNRKDKVFGLVELAAAGWRDGRERFLDGFEVLILSSAAEDGEGALELVGDLRGSENL